MKRLNTAAARQGQGELVCLYRFHAVFTNTPEPTLIAEAHHRDHAIVEQVIADLKNSALKHFLSGSFSANGAWLACAVIAYNLCRAVGVLAGGKFGNARTVTIREQLIKIPARIAYSACRYRLHLPRNNRHQHRYISILDAIQAPPTPG